MCSADSMCEQAAWAWGFLRPEVPLGANTHLLKLAEKRKEIWLTFEFSTRFPTWRVQFSVLLSHLPAQPQRGLRWEGGWETASFPFLVLWNASSEVALLF